MYKMGYNFYNYNVLDDNDNNFICLAAYVLDYIKKLNAVVDIIVCAKVE